jgi:hypothetical protein
LGTLPLLHCDRKRALLPVSFDCHIKLAGGVPRRKPSHWGHPGPNPACRQYSLINRGNGKALSTYLPRSGKRRVFQCTRCETSFAETRATVFFDLRTPDEKGMLGLKMRLGKGDLAGSSFVWGVTEETPLAWLRRAAQQAERINTHLLRELPVPQVPRDEMGPWVATAVKILWGRKWVL